MNVEAFTTAEVVTPQDLLGDPWLFGLARDAGSLLALTCTPRHGEFWQVAAEEGGLDLRGPAGRDAVNWARISELRVFGGDFEVRWRRRGAGEGMARVLVEGEEVPSCPQGWRREPCPPVRGTLDRHYVLQGTAAEGPDPGWPALRHPRTGATAIPLEGLWKGGHAILHAREYLVQEPDYGNTTVWAERLLGLQAREART